MTTDQHGLNNDSRASAPAPESGRVWKWMAAAMIVFILLIANIAYRMSPLPASLLFKSAKSVAVPLPEGCSKAVAPSSDETTKYLASQQEQRGLIFSHWILCSNSAGRHKVALTLKNDSRWLPTYVPGAYQYRRAVIILPPDSSAFEGSSVAGEVCLLPWRRYISQIAGATEKFSTWE